MQPMQPMNLLYALRYLYYYMFFLFAKFMKQFQPPAQEPIKHKTAIEVYEESYSPKFLGIIKTLDKTVNHKYNTNIDDILYNRAQLLECMKDPSNPYEEKWRKRILYETTPRGNIVIHYDIFKQGFAYYSDQSMTYSILNIAAMKYCLYFSCLDFFIDEQVLLEHVSPFCKMIQDEEKTENNKKKESVKQMLPNMTGARFAKLKNYSMQSQDKARDKTIDKMQDKDKPTEQIINKFINLGKITNFSFLQKIPKKVTFDSSPTKFDEMFSDITVVNREVLNYKLFKENMNKQKLESSENIN